MMHKKKKKKKERKKKKEKKKKIYLKTTATIIDCAMKNKQLSVDNLF